MSAVVTETQPVDQKPTPPRAVKPARRWRTGLLLVAPSVVLLLAVFVTAMESMVEYSLQAGAPDGTTLVGTPASWQKFLTDGYYWRTVGETLLIGLLTTVATAVVGYLTAMALYQMRRKGWRNAGLGVVFSSFIFSGIVSVYAWQLLLGRSGFLNSVLGVFGLDPVSLLYERSAVIIALVHSLLPLMVLPILSSLYQIDGALAEAADDLGASRWRVFSRVTLPLSAPGLVAGCQLTFALTISAFTAPSLLGGGRVATLSTSIYSFVQTSDFPMASVTGLVLLVLALVAAGLFVVLQRRLADADRGGTTFSPAVPRGVRTLGVWMAVVWAFELIPAFIVVVSSFSSVAYGEWPPPGLSLRWYRNLFAQAEAWPAFLGSIEIALAVVVLAVSLGLAASLALVRFRFKGVGAVQSALMSPLVVPKIAFGFAAFMLLYRLDFGSGRIAVVAAHTVASVPFVIALATAALLRADRTLDEAAIDLGASPLTAFVRSTLPQIMPAVLVSAVVCFLASFNEVDLSIFLLSGDQQTLPVWMFNYLNNYQDPTPAALSTLMSLVSVVVVVIVGLALLRSTASRRLNPLHRETGSQE